MSPSPVPAAASLNASFLLDALDAAAVLLDAATGICHANPLACELFGGRAEELLGKSEAEWQELLQRRFTGPNGEEIRWGAAAGAEPIWLETRGVPRLTWEYEARPVRGPGGAPVGRLDTLREVTSLARREKEIERERERHVRELATQNTRQEQAEKFQLELTANVTHDLKTPIASIKASVSGLLADDVAYDPQTLREALTVIDQETDRLQRRVQNLLSLARMESGDAPLHRDWVDMADIVATARESLRGAQAARELRVEIPDDLPLILADYEQLLNAIRNLLENAYLYSPPDQPVEISVSVSLGQLRIRIRDHGQGLMPDEFEKIFDKFYRGRSARRIPGTGLGLPICRAIAHAHGGHLWAEHAVGGGVAFVLSIPFDSAAPEGEINEQNTHTRCR